MNRFVAVAVVVVAMPFIVGLARASLSPVPEKKVVGEVVKGPHELTAVAEPQALPRRYGVQVVAMPAVPRADGREPVAESRLPMTDGREPMADSRGPMTDGRLPITDSRAPLTEAQPLALSCPDVRAIVTGDSPFAVIAWNEQSQVISAGKTIRSPSGDVMVRRIVSKSITFAQADTTLQCKLLVR